MKIAMARRPWCFHGASWRFHCKGNGERGHISAHELKVEEMWAYEPDKGQTKEKLWRSRCGENWLINDLRLGCGINGNKQFNIKEDGGRNVTRSNQNRRVMDDGRMYHEGIWVTGHGCVRIRIRRDRRHSIGKNNIDVKQLRRRETSGSTNTYECNCQ